MNGKASETAMYAADCPRCGQARTTFDILAATKIGQPIGWEQWEAFLRCRSCFRPSIALLEEQNASNPAGPLSNPGSYANFGFGLRNWVFEVPNRRATPEHVPAEIARIFEEAAICAAIGTWDAAGTMFRKVLDVATRRITPKPDSGEHPCPANWKVYKDLRLRLDWLFENNRLSAALRDLSSCIHEDGNDAAHDADGIRQAEAEDLADFTETVLKTLFTVPGQIAENRKRRDQRRGVSADAKS